jgi:hypothetical protein
MTTVPKSDVTVRSSSTPMHSIGPSELVLMSIIYLYYNERMYSGGLKEMPCFRTHIKLVDKPATGSKNGTYKKWDLEQFFYLYYVSC